MVVDSNEVDEEGSPTYHGWDQKGPNEHLLNPSSACIIQKTQYEKHKVTLKNNHLHPGKRGRHSFITSLFCVQASPKVAIYRGGGSIHKNGCAQHGSSPAEKNDVRGALWSL